MQKSTFSVIVQYHLKISVLQHCQSMTRFPWFGSFNADPHIKYPFRRSILLFYMNTLYNVHIVEELIQFAIIWNANVETVANSHCSEDFMQNISLEYSQKCCKSAKKRACVHKESISFLEPVFSSLLLNCLLRHHLLWLKLCFIFRFISFLVLTVELSYINWLNIS